MKRYGSNIQEVKLSTTLRTGIEIVSIPGLIPEIYERSACNAANYQFETSWQALSEWEKAQHIAQYILNNLIDTHTQDAQTKEMKRNTKKT